MFLGPKRSCVEKYKSSTQQECIIPQLNDSHSHSIKGKMSDSEKCLLYSSGYVKHEAEVSLVECLKGAHPVCRRD